MAQIDDIQEYPVNTKLVFYLSTSLQVKDGHVNITFDKL